MSASEDKKGCCDRVQTAYDSAIEETIPKSDVLSRYTYCCSLPGLIFCVLIVSSRLFVGFLFLGFAAICVQVALALNNFVKLTVVTTQGESTPNQRFAV